MSYIHAIVWLWSEMWIVYKDLFLSIILPFPRALWDSKILGASRINHQDLYVFDLETSNGALLPALQRAYVLTGNGPSSCSTIGRLERVRSQQTPATNIMEGTTVCLCGCTSTLTLQQHIIHHRYTFGSLQKQQQQTPHSCGTRMLRSLAVTPCQAHTEAILNT